MPQYTAEDWERLGRAVKYARRRKDDLDDTKKWASAVGRSSRMLLGLERGESVGEKTLERIDQALEWPAGRSYDILDGENVVVNKAGEVLLQIPQSHYLIRESGEIVGEVERLYPDPESGPRRDFSTVTDADVATLIIEAGDELRRRALARLETALDMGDYSPESMAAYRPDLETEYQRTTVTQDRDAEGPDQPSPEDPA